MLFAMDLDGTLLLPKLPQFDDYIENSLREIIAKGHEVVFVTGRNYYELIEEKNLWGMPCYIIGLNGEVILDKKRNIIYQNSLDKTVVSGLYANFYDFPFEYITFDSKLVTVDENSFKKHFISSFPENFFEDEKMKEYLEEILKLNSYNISQEDLLNKDIIKVELMNRNKDLCFKLSQGLYQEYPNKLTCLYDGNALTICNEFMDKAKALQLLCSYLNINHELVYVFGDGSNDITMLKQIENSYAVENASVKVKEVAKNIIEDNCHYGVIKAIMQILGQD